ncbi:Ku protein [Streptomyces sp. NPDC091266]|uniref:non-homologous end joining protein Ku n=1 Tax=Streptomyces sp. NPDC091266 TaxID=3365978 RepID=UPI00382E941F
MRSVWNGSISFGLVTIPVKTYSATDRTSSVSFVRVHEKDGGQIHYRKICELDGEEVPNEEVGKGYQAPDDDAIVPITDDDLSRLPLPTAKTLAILSFVDPGEIDPLQMDKAYYLGPNGLAAAKPYALLREALEHHRKVAIGKVSMRGRESLAMLRAHNGALVMHALLWPDQMRPATGIAPDDVEIRENELTLAETLMDSLGELDPAELHDDYREAVEQLVAAKLEGGEVAAPEADTSGGQVIDLMAALEKSVQATQAGEGNGGGSSGAKPASVTSLRGGKRSGTKKTAEKTAEKKTAAAKKTTAGSGPARKTTGSTAKKTAASPKATSGTSKATSKTTAHGASKGASGGSASTAQKSGTRQAGAKKQAGTGKGTGTGKAAGSGTGKKTAKKTSAAKSGKRASA